MTRTHLKKLSIINTKGGNTYVQTASIPILGSIFTTETHAIHLALNTIYATKGKNFYRFTDSRSCLQALQMQIPTNPKDRKVKHTIENLRKSGKAMELCCRYSRKRNR